MGLVGSGARRSEPLGGQLSAFETCAHPHIFQHAAVATDRVYVEVNVGEGDAGEEVEKEAERVQHVGQSHEPPVVDVGSVGLDVAHEKWQKNLELRRRASARLSSDSGATVIVAGTFSPAFDARVTRVPYKTNSCTKAIPGKNCRQPHRNRASETCCRDQSSPT